MARLNRNRDEEGGDNRLPPSTKSHSGEHVIPDVSQDLINYLNRTFPNTLPPSDGADPIAALNRAWGKREVIDHLIRLQEQNEQDNHVLRRRIDATQSRDPGSTAAASG